MKADWIRTALKQPSGFLILIGALGLVLILLGDAGGAQAAEVQSADTRTQIEAYGAQLEERLEALVESIDGAGEAQVMITFETSGETVYALDERSGQDGSYQTEHVLADGQPITETIVLPPVQGVAVLCQGADNVSVQAKVTETVSVLLGVTSNRISIAKMSEWRGPV